MDNVFIGKGYSKKELKLGKSKILYLFLISDIMKIGNNIKSINTNFHFDLSNDYENKLIKYGYYELNDNKVRLRK